MINLASENVVKHIQKANDIIDEFKAKLYKESLYDAQGAMLRAKSRWVSQAEINSKYFFGLKKTKAKSKTMCKTMREDGTLTRNPKEVLDIQSKFYAKLYKVDPEIECKINIQPERKITNDQKVILDGEFTMEEMVTAIKSMALKKSPGIDGLPIDFYVVFFTRIKDFLFEALKIALETGFLHSSARDGIISLISKRDCNLDWVRNWRPIILLCADYKVLSKVLANRLKLVLNDIIEESQTGFLKGRYIGTNLRIILDLLEYTELHKIPGVFISVDFLKAFDRVHYQSLYETLRWFNFGGEFIRMSKVLFTDFRLSTINNGYTSKPFTPTRGLFQGNPAAPYYFIIIMELLESMLRANKKIKGIKMGEQEILTILFADDLGLALKFSQEVWDEASIVFRSFQDISGMLINYEKSVVYRIGLLRDSNAKFYSSKKLFWTDKPFKVLGITVTNDKTELENMNYNPILDRAKFVLETWKQ